MIEHEKNIADLANAFSLHAIQEKLLLFTTKTMFILASPFCILIEIDHS